MKFNTKRSDRASEIYEQINMYDQKNLQKPQNDYSTNWQTPTKTHSQSS